MTTKLGSHLTVCTSLSLALLDVRSVFALVHFLSKSPFITHRHLTQTTTISAFVQNPVGLIRFSRKANNMSLLSTDMYKKYGQLTRCHPHCHITELLSRTLTFVLNTTWSTGIYLTIFALTNICDSFSSGKSRFSPSGRICWKYCFVYRPQTIIKSIQGKWKWHLCLALLVLILPTY